MYKTVSNVWDARYKVSLFEAGQLKQHKNLSQERGRTRGEPKMEPVMSRSPRVEGKRGEWGACLLSLSGLYNAIGISDYMILGGCRSKGDTPNIQG